MSVENPYRPAANHSTPFAEYDVQELPVGMLLRASLLNCLVPAVIVVRYWEYGYLKVVTELAVGLAIQFWIFLLVLLPLATFRRFAWKQAWISIGITLAGVITSTIILLCVSD